MFLLVKPEERNDVTPCKPCKLLLTQNPNHALVCYYLKKQSDRYKSFDIYVKNEIEVERIPILIYDYRLFLFVKPEERNDVTPCKPCKLLLTQNPNHALVCYYLKKQSDRYKSFDIYVKNLKYYSLSDTILSFHELANGTGTCNSSQKYETFC